MDWGYNGKSENPTYKSGLFMDLSCTYAITKAKSCINVERLCELGVNLDSTFKKEFSDGGKISYGTMESDGIINKVELEDNDARAMFATMNHVGFVPKDEVGKYDSTQIVDNRTRILSQ